MFAITFMWTYVRADAQTTQTEVTAQLTTFMRTDVRADAQTTTELPAYLTTFITTDVRADAQTTAELTAQLTIESTTESIAQLIQKPIMRVRINDLERPRKLDVSVTFGGALCDDCKRTAPQRLCCTRALLVTT